MAFPKTAVVDKDGKFLKLIASAAEKKEFEGQEVTFVTKSEYKPADGGPSWDEFIGKVKPATAEDTKVTDKTEAKPRSAAPDLKGPYHLLKPLPACPEDHPKKPIWVAIEENEGGTCEDAVAACPEKNPPRKTSGVYTFASEFRYFLKTGYAALGEKPEGFDYKAVVAEAKPKKEKKAKAEKTEETSNTSSDNAEQNQAEGAQA